MSTNEAGKVFRRRKVLTIEEVAHRLDRSIVTARRRLKEWGACTSYNEYGRYYTLPSIALYNECGIWKCGKALFSRYGNLKETFCGVVRESKAGLNAFEISEVMQLKAHTFLAHFKDHAAVRREKYKGLYFYFSSDGKVFKEQRHQRELVLRNAAKLRLPSDADSVLILVELIKHPKDDLRQLSRRVRRKGAKVSIDEVGNLLLYHNILKKNARAKGGTERSISR